MIVIQLSWSENENKLKEKKIKDCYIEAFKELKRREVLCLGIAESSTLAVQNLFLFLWTPVLIETTSGGDTINIGFIFLCLVTSIIVGTKVFEILILYLQIGLYNVLLFVLITIFSALTTIYFFDSFLLRLILFSVLNGICGLYQPLFSFIKYRVLEDKHRALLMNIFRIPLNLYVVASLLMLRFLDPLNICLIAALISLFALFIILSLLIFKPDIPDNGRSAFKRPKLSFIKRSSYNK